MPTPRPIVSSVRTRPLSIGEIEDLGIVIDPTKFSVYEFTFGVGTTSNPLPITFPVTVGSDPKSLGGGGGSIVVPVGLPGLDVPSLELLAHDLLVTRTRPDGKPVNVAVGGGRGPDRRITRRVVVHSAVRAASAFRFASACS